MKSITTLIALVIMASPSFAATTKKSKNNSTNLIETISENSNHTSHHSGSLFNGKVELATNPVVTGSINGLGSSLDIPTSGGSVGFNMGAEANIKINEEFQISVPIFLFFSSATVFQLNAGPQYNFGEKDLLNQFFATLRPGIMIASSQSSFVLNGAFGKRFKITESVAYRPAVGCSFFAAPSDANFYITPASFSIEL